MNREQLQDIFRQPYNAQTWQELLINLFGASEIYKEPKRTSLTSDINEKVEGFKLGRLYTADRHEIGLFAFEIKGGMNLKLNRVGLRSLVKSYTRLQVDAAIVVFYDSTHWRLSFICDIEEQKTATKRYTYVFGNPNESYRTASAMLAKLSEGKPSFENIKAAFSVEALSKDFFKGYKEQYAKFCKHIGGDEKWQRDYVKKMLGRLVFLQFLQKKGWLNGDYNYLKELYSKSDYKSDYLERVLEPLFFGVLNTKPEDREAIFKRKGWDLSLLAEWESITYLNGGLFEADENDKRQERFREELFADLFEFFSHYNFTIDENDPNDAEVGIDPEMLGHIFENLLEDNKDKGAFYTPKEIVQYMCRQSLIEYLKTHTKDDLHEDITQIVNNHIVSKSLQSKENARHIDTLLKEVKICDPAIGSGAFPMGLLNEIFAIRKLLFGFLGHNVDFNNAEIKKEIIQNNIYGVDIEQGAVDIARLRFWLSLVVDEEKPQPLPNLDYKIMQGNSLLESFMGVDLSKFSDSSVAQLDMLLTLFEADGTHKAIMELTKEYFTITDHQTKFELRHKINNKVKEHIKKCSNNKPEVVEAVEALKEGNYPFFLWHVYFNDVFERGGFDIVIGNPPYIQLQVNGGLLAGQLKGEKYETFARTGDIYCIFYERGLQILREGGIETYITSNKWMRAGYGEKLREYLTKNNPLQLLDLGAGVFESATVDTNILVVQKGLNNNEFRGATYSARDFNNIILAPINVSGGDIWTILSPLEQSIKSKIESVGTPLKDWDVEIYRGVLTGYNEAFIINTAKRDELVAADPRSAEIIKPILRGRDIKRYAAQWAGLWLINTHNGVRGKIERIKIEDYPAVKSHLDEHWTSVFIRQDQGDTPYNLRNCAYLEQFEKEKIVYPETTQGAYFYYDRQGFAIEKTCFMIVGAQLQYLSSILSSKLMTFSYKAIFSSIELGRNGYQYNKHALIELPLVKLSIEEQQPFIDLVDEILEAKKANPTADTTALEAQIDTMVYALYNLTPDEIAIIEK